MKPEAYDTVLSYYPHTGSYLGLGTWVTIDTIPDNLIAHDDSNLKNRKRNDIFQGNKPSEIEPVTTQDSNITAKQMSLNRESSYTGFYSNIMPLKGFYDSYAKGANSDQNVAPSKVEVPKEAYESLSSQSYSYLPKTSDVSDLTPIYLLSSASLIALGLGLKKRFA